ncbi:MAG: type II secretion system protein [Phycisphaerae bacterium]
MANRPRHHRAFTLIELLVVIAIIALLVAIIVPSLDAARRSAKAVVCVTQQKYIATAWQFYLGDSQDTFPPLIRNMQWFYGGKEPGLIGPSSWVLPYRPLNPYVGRTLKSEACAEQFRCPADNGIRGLNGNPDVTEGHAAYDYFGNSFMMNWCLLQKFDPVSLLPVPGPVRLSDVTIHYSRVVVAGDAQWYYSVVDGPYDALWHFRDERMNLVFLDGHAKLTQIIHGRDVSDDYSLPPFSVPAGQ